MGRPHLCSKCQCLLLLGVTCEFKVATALLPTELFDLLDMFIDGVRRAREFEEKRRCLFPLLLGRAGFSQQRI
ncbi:hypothetical protein KC348_g81 [Hortaea werneckii]|nr:hypothetical protein KC348_g81 [Hortaea werneckii]